MPTADQERQELEELLEEALGELAELRVLAAATTAAEWHTRRGR